MAKKNNKPLDKRKREFELLQPFGIESTVFNDYYHLRIISPRGDKIDYYPVSEKWSRVGRWYRGLDELIEYLDWVS